MRRAALALSALAGLGAAAALLTWRRTAERAALLQPAGYVPPDARGPITIWASYREPEGDSRQPLTMDGEAPAMDVMLVVQQLSSCVLRAEQLGLPTRVFKIDVTQDGRLLSRYERDPARATSFWRRTEGLDLGDLNRERPPCRPPFCTGDLRRLASGSASCRA